MRIVVRQVVEVDDGYRRAIRLHYGLDGLATRDEVKRWVVSYGTSADADLLWELQQHDKRQEENGS
jgi:hypothetical protein